MSVDALKKLLRTDGPVSGRVVNFRQGRAVVATSAGPVEATPSGSLSTGDKVIVQAGIATRRTQGGGREYRV
ncbi:MAG: hypothetical protein HQL52_17465 [Magnetococcales bacterium]|nr:hypothetical protein [Magnetococcales bacterium]